MDLAVTAALPRNIDRPRLATLAIHGTGIGLSAFLLFSVEPLVGRLALPVFGGVPAGVEITCPRRGRSRVRPGGSPAVP